jgi:hypothetical protein
VVKGGRGSSLVIGVSSLSDATQHVSVLHLGMETDPVAAKMCSLTN